VLAAHERALARARARATTLIKRDRKEVRGTVPWGLRREGRRLVRDRAEERVTAVILHMREQGFTYREIVAFLRASGYETRRGTAIGVTKVFEIVQGGRKKGPRRTRTDAESVLRR
jgi:DNA invertase Pin-like site-specific DNA recombinase